MHLDYTHAWEQRKLGDIARRVTRKNENLESQLPLTISAQYGLVDQTEFFNNRVASQDLSGYYLVQKGEFAYNKSTSSDSPWGAVKRLERYTKGCVSTLYIVFEAFAIDPTFLVTYYMTDRWYKGVQAIAAEGARNHGLLNIAPADFFETELSVPSSAAEQAAIGSLFSHLDDLITLHQREPPLGTYASRVLHEARERAHDQIDILVLELLDDVQVRFLRRVHARVSEPLCDAGDRDPGEEEQRGMGVPQPVYGNDRDTCTFAQALQHRVRG